MLKLYACLLEQDKLLARHDVLDLRIQNTYIKNVETGKYLGICIDK